MYGEYTTLGSMVPLLTVVLVLVYVFTVPGRRGNTLPPGPPTIPVLGNLHQLPREKAFLKFAEWAKLYGEIYSLKIASNTMVVISSRRIVKELMDKRSSISSHRPPLYAVNDLVYKGHFLLLMNADHARFRQQRKIIHQFYMESVCEKNHMSYITAESAQLMVDLLKAPHEFHEHAKRYTNSLIMSTVYGIRTPSITTDHLLAIIKVSNHMSRVIMPGALPPVDIFPFLNYVPERVFGNWKSKCLDVARASDALYGGLLDRVIERRARTGSKDTFADRILDVAEKENWNRHEIMYLLATVLDAGTDTTASGWTTLVQMLTRDPSILKLVQTEIDNVVGDDRCPTWADFDKLPMVNSLMKEVQRFRPIVPIAFPHALSEATEIDGYLLPKGTSVVVNISALHYDEKKFANPSNFDPKNFTGKNRLASAYANAADYEERDHYGYGFGRRLCPGIHFAERSLFVTFAKLMWAFDIGPAKDEDGRPIPVNIDWATGYSGGAILHANDFETSISVRSEKRRETLLKELREAQETFKFLD